MDVFRDAVRGASNESGWIEFARRLDTSHLAELSHLVRGLRTAKPLPAPAPEAQQSQWAGDEFAVVNDTNCSAPRAKVSLLIREDSICLQGKSGQQLVVPRSLVQHRVHVTISDRFKKFPLALFVLVLGEPVRWGRTTLRAVAMQAPTKRHTGGAGGSVPEVFVPRCREIDSSRLAAALPLRSVTEESPASKPRTGWKDAPGCLLEHFLTAVFGSFATEDRSEFVSSESETSIKCFLNVQEGLLWPLRQGVLFGPKPAVFLPRHEIASAQVSRAQQTSRTFDLDIERVEASVGEKGKKSIQFSMLETHELDRVRSYLEERRFGDSGDDATKEHAGKPAESKDGTAAENGGAEAHRVDDDEEDDRDFNTDDESDTSDDDDDDENGNDVESEASGDDEDQQVDDDKDDEEDIGEEDSERSDEDEDDEDEDDSGSEAPVTIVVGKAEAETDDESAESGQPSANGRRDRPWTGGQDEPASKRQRP